MTSAHEICTAMRNCKTLSHEDFAAIAAGFAALAQKPNALSENCTSIVVDMMDEMTGQIENDKIEQQTETSWVRRDMRGFEGTRGQLDALTMRLAA